MASLNVKSCSYLRLFLYEKFVYLGEWLKSELLERLFYGVMSAEELVVAWLGAGGVRPWEFEVAAPTW